MISAAERLSGISEYYFSGKLREIEEMKKRGAQVLNLGIGSPDLPPHPNVIRILAEEAAKPNNHAYQNYKGSLILRSAFADFYQRFYQVQVQPDCEILPLIGSKEGILHICMAYLGPGDKALVPNPGYPAYSAAVKLAGAEPVPYLLAEDNEWYPDFSALSRMELNRVKLMFLNYPNMPTGAAPQQEKFEQFVLFAQQHGILLVHDNPYSMVLNPEPISLLSISGAFDCALELNSLSKSANMAGWRVGAVFGKKEYIDTIVRFKSNMDSGMFLPVQLAAAGALSLPNEWYQSLNAVYRSRKEKAYSLLHALGCNIPQTQTGMFLWAAVPEAYADGYALTDSILQRAFVFITPGGIFGNAGNNYVRISLCSPAETFLDATNRILSLTNDFN